MKAKAKLKPVWFLCDKYGAYVAVTGDGYAVLIDGPNAVDEYAERFATMEDADEAAQSFSFALGVPVRVVSHML